MRLRILLLQKTRFEEDYQICHPHSQKGRKGSGFGMKTEWIGDWVHGAVASADENPKHGGNQTKEPIHLDVRVVGSAETVAYI